MHVKDVHYFTLLNSILYKSVKIIFIHQILIDIWLFVVFLFLEIILVCAFLHVSTDMQEHF